MIVLDSNYTIVTDANNYELRYNNKKIVDKINKNTNETEQKEVTESWAAYYPSLQGCLRKYVNECIKPDSEFYADAKALLSKIDEVHETIKNIKS